MCSCTKLITSLSFSYTPNVPYNSVQLHSSTLRKSAARLNNKPQLKKLLLAAFQQQVEKRVAIHHYYLHSFGVAGKLHRMQIQWVKRKQTIQC